MAKKSKAKVTTTPRRSSKFSVNTNNTTKQERVSVLKPKARAHPEVLFSLEAHAKIRAIEASDRTLEVGWLMTSREISPNVYLIDKVYVPEQEVTAIATDIDNGKAYFDALCEWADSKPAEGEQMNVWFHLHPKMGVSPSNTDEIQMEKFFEDFPDVEFWIRGIVNSRGERKIDLYRPQEGYAYTNLNWDIDIPEYTESVAEMMKLIDQRAVESRVQQGGWYGSGQGAFYQGNVQPHTTFSGKKRPQAKKGELDKFRFEVDSILGDYAYITNKVNNITYKVTDSPGGRVIALRDNKRVNLSPYGTWLLEEAYWEYMDAVTGAFTDTNDGKLNQEIDEMDRELSEFWGEGTLYLPHMQ